jgi:hypothetical protein
MVVAGFSLRVFCAKLMYSASIEIVQEVAIDFVL